jgi:hypothetical protein
MLEKLGLNPADLMSKLGAAADSAACSGVAEHPTVTSAKQRPHL